MTVGGRGRPGVRPQDGHRRAEERRDRGREQVGWVLGGQVRSPALKAAGDIGSAFCLSSIY